MDKEEKKVQTEKTVLEAAREEAELAELKSKKRIAEANAREAEANADKAENEAKNSKKSTGAKIFEGTCKVLSIVLPVTVFGGAVVLAERSHQDEMSRMSDGNSTIEKSGLTRLADLIIRKF